MIAETIEQFRKELRDAILNKEVELKFKPTLDDGYIFSLTAIVRFGSDGKYNKEISFTIAKTFVCYHEELTEGIFDNDIPELIEMYREYFDI